MNVMMATLAMEHTVKVSLLCSILVCDSSFLATDIDECKSGNNSCHTDASCRNTVGSYTCECHPGFYGDGYTCTSELGIILENNND